MAAGRFIRAAAKLLDVLGRDHAALAGGLAVNAHGFPRATADVDIIVNLRLSEALRILREQAVTVRFFEGNPVDGDFSCLKGEIRLGNRAVDSIPFDVLPPLVSFDPEQAIDLTVRGQRLRVVDADTLIRLKLKAGSPHDLYDIAILANVHPEWRDLALAATARKPRLARRVQEMIDDPRTRAKAREAARREATAERRARKKT
jgi:hypothetical protein